MGVVKRVVRFSVSNFAKNIENTTSNKEIIFMEGCNFPQVFTYNSPGILDGVAFGVCVSGNARIKVNSKLYDMDESTAIVIMPNHIVEPIERSENFTLKLLLFSLDCVSKIKLDIDTVKILEENPCINVSESDKEIITKMFVIITKLNNPENNNESRPVILSMLNSLILELESIVKQSLTVGSNTKLSRAEDLTEQFLKLIIRNYKESREIEYYADKLCISPKYLTQVVKQTTGETPFNWMNKIVIIGAKNLIRTSEMNIMQISEELNFPNPSFFGRFFKKHSGMTPLEFKKT